MKDYKEFRFGSILFIITIPLQFFFIHLYRNSIDGDPEGMTSLTIGSGILIVILLLFYGMTTKVDDEKIVISFGVGLIRKTIGINKIKTVSIVKNPWYYGWGIRLIPAGVLYNITGSDGIELKFNNGKRVIRIGTKNPAQLRDEIIRRLSQ